jgi:type I restriction enzyme R subunit
MPDSTIDKKTLSERDICTKFITPAVIASNWRQTQVREEVTFTDGRVIVRGKITTRGKSKRADFILYYKANIPIAIIEAKDNKHSVGAGMQQGLEYAEILDIPFVYSSNGDGFIEHDRTVFEGAITRELALDEFPSPEELWQRYQHAKGFTAEQAKIITQDYFLDISGRSPRYYQTVAINRTLEAIAKGQDRILLVMATGTGKTYVAFQIIWRLWKSRTKRRILYLADRNILIDQTMTNDFKHFDDKMTKIRNRHVDKSYEIYLALYQGVSGEEEWQNIYQQFSPDFFDLIVIDECHRGSAREDSAWREILEYFKSATQIGLTATPKETKDISNSHYFGEPIYTYTLKQGIQDGFLAPYKVIRVSVDVDVEGWRPYAGQCDKFGNPIEDRIYNCKDFDRNIVIDERTKVVAKKVSDYLKESGDRFAKSIVFCVDIDHAERMRQALIDENADLFNLNHKYIMRITGDSIEGKMELDNFIDPKEKYPVLVTTSKLLTTGVDAQTCKLIVLDANINSMTEFKQIIGRGTRINEIFGKKYFTIMDFRKATELFSDLGFDGEPVQIYEPGINDPIVPPDDENVGEIDGEVEDGDETVYGESGDVNIGGEEIHEAPRKYYVKGVAVTIINQRVQYLDKNGDLISESLHDFTRKNVQEEYHSLDNFLHKWHHTDKKEAIIEELREQGVMLDELQEEVGKEYDPFDLICHVAFGAPAMTRSERANNVKKRNYFTKYGDKARTVLEALLDKYADEGVTNIENIKVLKIKPFDEFGSPKEIADLFGGKEQYLIAIKELEEQIYTA